MAHFFVHAKMFCRDCVAMLWLGTARIVEASKDGCRYNASMPVCKECGDDVDALETLKVAGKTKKMCEDCADRARESAEVAEQSEAVVQNMMGFKGRR